MLHEMLKKFFLHDSQSLSYLPLKLLPNTKRFVVRLLLECGLLVCYGFTKFIYLEILVSGKNRVTPCQLHI